MPVARHSDHTSDGSRLDEEVGVQRLAFGIHPVALEVLDPVLAKISSSMKKLPLHSAAGRVRITRAASATISGVRARRTASSPPSRLRSASVAMVVRGQSELAAMPRSRSSSASPSVQRLMPYLDKVDPKCMAAHFGARSSGGG